jgi:hypothetical protein
MGRAKRTVMATEQAGGILSLDEALQCHFAVRTVIGDFFLDHLINNTVHGYRLAGDGHGKAALLRRQEDYALNALRRRS